LRQIELKIGLSQMHPLNKDIVIAEMAVFFMSVDVHRL